MSIDVPALIFYMLRYDSLGPNVASIGDADSSVESFPKTLGLSGRTFSIIS